MARQFWYFLLLAGCTVINAGAMATESNLSFSGTLVSEPCDLDPNTTNITVDFESVIEKSVYMYTRTGNTLFNITLLDCDTSISAKVVMTFKGSESSSLPGLLAVTGTASGIAVGIELPDGTQLPVNHPASSMTLNRGTNSFVLEAYVEGEPDAIRNQTITPGDFTGIATFELTYP